MESVLQVLHRLFPFARGVFEVRECGEREGKEGRKGEGIGGKGRGRDGRGGGGMREELDLVLTNASYSAFCSTFVFAGQGS